MIDIRLKEFQEKAIDFLLDKTLNDNSKYRIILKSPTGSGKTIILISYIERYLNFSDSVFCWFCPGKGELEKQSKEKMQKFCPQLKTGDIDSILNNGFEPKTTYFINWEKITKKDNVAISDTERKNLFERISEAHNRNLNFVIIIDEEHNNDTKKADDIISSIHAKNEIRVSATPSSKAIAEFYEIPEVDVINEGLITRFMYINKDIDNVDKVENIQHETDILLQKADEVRKKILEEYQNIGEDVRPLVLVQFPNMNDELIQYVEYKLESMGYTYENGRLSSWFSSTDKKEKSKKLGIINLAGITKNNAKQDFLLFKQALSTGWDCPRAKILVKLRENMNETFEIQTLGRLRRMPKAYHYDNDILDCSYLYTFDEKYKLEVINKGLGIETQRVYLKNEAKNLVLQKEVRNANNQYYDEKLIRNRVYEFFKEKYNLSSNEKENRKKLEVCGYVFLGEYIYMTYLEGKYATYSEITESKEVKSMTVKVDTHSHGIDFRHDVNEIKKKLGLSYDKTHQLLKTLFRRGFGVRSYSLLDLTLKEFYAFIINNVYKFKEDFEAFEDINYKQLMLSEPKQEYFKIPLEEHYRYNPYEKDVVELESNVYKEYNTSMVEEFRSKSERLFEKYCDKNENVEYVYKNGDTGQQYLSIVYVTNVGKERLFYPDYIVKLKTGQIWLLETKGGETQGVDQNIDIEVKHKFDALLHFSKKNGYNFGFVRAKNEDLYINFTEYEHDMSDDKWLKIEKYI